MKGKLFIIVGPSGSGKSSVLHRIKILHPEYFYPLSATTRKIRDGEKDGDIYNFYNKKEFEDAIKNDELLEYALVHQQNYYGIIKKPIIKALKNGKVVVREVDIQGLDSIKKKINKKNLISIFITTPNKKDLINRIINRSNISENELKCRIESMHREFIKSRNCDYLIENKNGELKKTVEKVLKIIKNELRK